MPNKTWVVIRLGKWSHKATAMFLYDRIYRHGYKWTPFCIKSFRYVGFDGYADDVIAKHEDIGYDKGFRDGYAEALMDGLKQEVSDENNERRPMSAL